MTGQTYSADPQEWIMGGELDGLTLLYHRPSGQTHLLAEDAAAILTALAAGSADAGALVTALDLADADDADVIVSARLAELAEIGLARKA